MNLDINPFLVYVKIWNFTHVLKKESLQWNSQIKNVCKDLNKYLLIK